MACLICRPDAIGERETMVFLACAFQGSDPKKQ